LLVTGGTHIVYRGLGDAGLMVTFPTDWPSCATMR